MLYNRQDNSLLEMRGELQNSLPSESDGSAMQVDVNQTVHYMVHPSVDVDVSSSSL